MTEIKTHQQVNEQDTSLTFEISRLENTYSNREEKNNEPHRHNFFMVLLVKNASGQHFIDFNEYKLTNNQVFFISPGQVHQLIENEKTNGFSIVFSNQFLVRNNIPPAFIDSLNLFNDFGDTPPLSLNTIEFEKLINYAKEIDEIKTSDISFRFEAISSLLKLILIQCNNLSSLQTKNTQIEEFGNSILKNFKNLINDNYTTWHTTGNYAHQLNITPDHLNRVVKSLTGKTAKEHVLNRIIMEAKRLLYFTELSNKEIGHQLGFYEPANFSAFFKKHTSLSPTKFKEIT